jgi:hypothetical protein
MIILIDIQSLLSSEEMQLVESSQVGAIEGVSIS